MKKNALVIGAGVWQMPMINFLKNKGFKVFVVDPYIFSPGVKIADGHLQSDVRYADEVIPMIGDKPFEIITSDQSDIAVKTVAKLTEHYHLQGNKLEAVMKFSNKFFMRQLAQKLKLPIPVFAKIESVQHLHDFAKKNGFPFIMKPADSQSSRGVFKIDSTNFHDIKNLFSESMKFSNCGYILAEEFVSGTELTVEGFASGYKHRTLAISSKKHFRTAIASSLEYPAQEIPGKILEEVEKANDYFVENSGLKFGITHAEYMVQPQTGKIYLIEIACRGGGSLISSDIINWVSGVDVYEYFFENLSGGVTDVKNLNVLKRNAVLHFFEFGTGKVKAISGIKEAEKIPGVHFLKLFISEGDEIVPATDDRSRQGMAIIFAESKEELDAKLKTAEQLLKVKFE
ncbi:MAG TPA: ATP-grasp domain-containing protein [Bacteroidia bacterium]|nr:ATP-grasp domain-containing protein [Bacteroidia bacterium]